MVFFIFFAILLLIRTIDATAEDEIQDGGRPGPSEATYLDDDYSPIQPAKYLLSSLNGDIGNLGTPAPAPENAENAADKVLNSPNNMATNMDVSGDPAGIPDWCESENSCPLEGKKDDND